MTDLPERIDIPPEAPWLRRIALRTPTLPPATHTNTYVLGDGGLLIVDPATPYKEEEQRLFAYLAELMRQGHPVEAAFLTHHHVDHVGAASALCKEFQIPLLAHRLTKERLLSRGILVTREIAEGDTLPYGPGGAPLQVLHTPGHAPGHLCLIHGQVSNAATTVKAPRVEAVVGDMVASEGTIVIDPDDGGRMGEYLAQLKRLALVATLDQDLRLWPAHGAAVEDGRGLLAYYQAHRLGREAKVVRALQTGAETLRELVVLAYDDVPKAIHPLAERSLLAHLEKLVSEGRVTLEEGQGRYRLRSESALPRTLD